MPSNSQKKKKRLRSRADKLWYQKHLKARCEVCGKPATQVHHYHPKGCYGHLRYDEDNAISLCQGCHFSHHHKGDPKIHDTIRKKRGKKWENRLKKKAYSLPDYKTTIEYYEERIGELTSVRID